MLNCYRILRQTDEQYHTSRDYPVQNTIIEKGYSDDYLKTIQNQMTALFNHAKKLIYIWQMNPCDKVKQYGKDFKKENEVLGQLKNIGSFMTGIDTGSKYYVLFELLFWTGARGRRSTQHYTWLTLILKESTSYQ